MANQKPIKVLIIDDSLLFCRFLSGELPKADSNIQIVGYAMNPYEALTKIPTLKPDVITLDVEMPKVNGIDFLKELLPKHLLPVILVSSLNVSVFDALSSGAVDFVKKPDMSRNYSTQIFLNNLVSKIYIASNAHVKLPASYQNSSAVRRPATDTVARPSGNTPGNASTSPLLAAKLTGSSLRLNNMIVAIGASTGGTEATLDVLKQLPADIPGIVITQHMPEGFTKMYAERLNRLCKMEVKEAQTGDVLRRGLALIAPGGEQQMKVVRSGRDFMIRCFPGDKVNGHRPSVDVLFDSVALESGRNSVGIILTGMGQDGAKGLLNMRKAGAYTIGQDKESCVVYGMPMVAQQLGGVCIQSSCNNIAHVLMKHLNSL